MHNKTVTATHVKQLELRFCHFIQESFSYSGKMPYSGLGGMEVVDFLKSGQRLKQPHGCPDEMYISAINLVPSVFSEFKMAAREDVGK